MCMYNSFAPSFLVDTGGEYDGGDCEVPAFFFCLGSLCYDVRVSRN